MKYAYWTAGVVLALVVGILVLQTIASERIEVVELHTLDESGEEVITRLWVVDDEGYQYLRVGGGGSGWFSRIQANGEIELTRNGTTLGYTVQRRPGKSVRINQLMQEKYTWGDDFIAMLVGSREGSIPLELHPL